MDSIVMCGYSVHRQYTSQGEKGRFYTFRLQSHGECDARLNGEPLRLKKGDLLMLVPAEPTPSIPISSESQLMIYFTS